MNGAKILLKCLEKEGIKTVFGIPGGALLKLYDEIKASPIQHILTRHEQGAIHAADGYSRVTGKVGVCIATSGPGAANLITGLGNAYSDSVPLVAITGQVSQSVLGKDAFQEINTVGLSQPVTKHNYLVKDANDIPRIVREAFFIATGKRPGPVLIDIPKDVFEQEVDESCMDNNRFEDHIYNKFVKPSATDAEVDKVITAINKAKKPLFLIGNGVVIPMNASKYLFDLIDDTDFLVTNTLLGKGAFPEGHVNAVGMLGMHGTFKANYATQNCDLLINIGSRFDDRNTCNVTGFLRSAEYIIHVDIDGTEHSKNVKTDLEIHSDSELFLKMLLDKKNKIKNLKRPEWTKEVLNKNIILNNQGDSKVHPINVSKRINDLITKDTVIVTDVGQHQMFAALYMKPKNVRSFVSSGGLGTMGYGLPAAIGSAFGTPEKNIILITGDGSFQMCFQELILLKIYNLNVKVVIYDNNCLGMVRQWQELFFKSNYAHTIYDLTPDWNLLAQSFGLDFLQVDSEDDLPKLDEAIKKVGPVVIAVNIVDKSNVYPMVAPADSLDIVKGE